MGSMKDLLGDAPAPIYPLAPGFKEKTTSMEAAASIAPHVDDLQHKTLAKIAEMPRTADEVAAALDASVLAIRPRCSELRKLHQIRPRIGPDGKPVRRSNYSGRPATVWEVGSE